LRRKEQYQFFELTYKLRAYPIIGEGVVRCRKTAPIRRKDDCPAVYHLFLLARRSGADALPQ
jgi:hypothetical protein